MFKLILLLILVATFDLYQVDAGKYVRDVSISLSDVTKTFKINMKLQRISSTRLVNIYFILSHNSECIRRVIFRCSKCNSSDSTDTIMPGSKCPQTIVPYNSTDSRISYKGRDKKINCGSYTATIISHDMKIMTFEAIKNKEITSTCFDINKLRLSSIERSCSSAKMRIKFTPPNSNARNPVLEYRVTIKSRNRRSCILTTTFKCRDCNDTTSLLPDTDIKLEGCFKLRSKMTYSKKQRQISFQISDSRISLATKYIVIIEPATKCSKCPRSYKYLKTKSKHICYKIRNLRISSTRGDCTRAKIQISFIPSVSNSKWSVLKYRIIIRSEGKRNCVLTTTLKCRDCKGRQSRLLSDNDQHIRGCFKSSKSVTFSKHQKIISFQIDNPRIAMGTKYSVKIEPATRCTKCSRSYKSFKTISSHACYKITKWKYSSYRRDCSSAGIRISFNQPISISKWSVLKYRVTLKSSNNRTCILTASFNCKTCKDHTTLLPDNDIHLRGCIKSNKVTFRKRGNKIYVRIDDPRIKLQTKYTVIIESATKCSKCLTSYKYLRTVSRHVCSSVQSFSVVSNYLTCSTAKLFIKFRPPSSNNGQPVLRYIIRVKTTNSKSCILSSTLDCRDCNDRTKLLMHERKGEAPCQHLGGHWTYSKRSRTISLEIRNSNIRMSTVYRVNVEPVTKCTRCKPISHVITTVNRNSYPNQCRRCLPTCRWIT